MKFFTKQFNFLPKMTLLSLSMITLSACQPEVVERSVQGKTEAKGEEYAHCNNTVPFGFPQFNNVDKKRDKEMVFSCHDNYTLNFNKDYRIAYWVAEHIKGEDLKKYAQEEKRKDKVRFDVNLPEIYGDLADEEYANANEKGYIYRPFATTKNWLGNQRAMSKTYYWTNMFPFPQDRENIEMLKKYNLYLEKVEKENKQKELNGEELIKVKKLPKMKNSAVELWNNIEDQIRDYIKKDGEGYIISGPVFYKTNSFPDGYIDRFGVEQESTANFMDRFKENDIKKSTIKTKFSTVGLVAPSHIYKLVYLPKENKTIVYIVKNSIPDSNNNILDTNPNAHRQSLETLEKLTNINFFPNKK